MKTTSRITLTLGIFLMVALALTMLSCGRSSKNTGEKLIEKAIEKETGENANVDLSGEKMVIESEGNRIEFDGDAKTWPAEIPADVPEFHFGKITGVTTTESEGAKTWTIIFEKMESGFLDKYNASLKEKGFEPTIMKVGDEAGTITVDTEKYGVFLMGDKNNASVAVQVK